MSTDALPQQAQAAQATAADEVAPEAVPQTAVAAPAQNQVATPAQDPVTAQDQVAAQDESSEREENLETRAAARLHDLVASGAEKLPGEAGSTVSRLAVALLSFGSQAAAKDPDKSTSALVGEAVGLFKSLDDDAGKQRAAMEHALETFTTSTLGDKERSQVLDVAEEAMGLWGKLRGTTSELAKSDAAVSMRSLAGALRKEGRDDEADETENEAKRLES